MNTTRLGHAIRTTATLLTISIALGAFILSYETLSRAAETSFPHPYNLLWPLILDGFILAGSIEVLRCELHHLPTRWPWTVTIGAVLLSTAFNVHHAPHTWLGVGTAALPPLAQALSFEFLMRTIRGHLTPAPVETEPTLEPEPMPEPMPEPTPEPEPVRVDLTEPDPGNPAPPAPQVHQLPTSLPHPITTTKTKPTRTTTKTTGGKAALVHATITTWEASGQDPYARGAAVQIAAEAGVTPKYARDILKTLQNAQ